MEMPESFDSDILHKMRKENGKWLIYDSETFMIKFAILSDSRILQANGSLPFAFFVFNLR